MMADFDFMSEYRALQPLQTRDILEARSASFQKIKAAVSANNHLVSDLAHFAYRIPHTADSTSDAWFEGIVRESDSTFSIEQDREDAARISALVLRDRLSMNVMATPVVVHAASFVGKRETADKGALSTAARQTIQHLVRRRGTPAREVAFVGPSSAATGPLIAKFKESNDQGDEIEILEAVIKDYNAQVAQLVTSVNGANAALYGENRRLAEEVDLLWWHLGRHSTLVDKALEQVPDVLKPIVIGMELANLINILPGPFGVYGIIRQSLGEHAEKTLKLSDAIKDLSADYTNLARPFVEDYGMAPVHGAVTEAGANGGSVNATQFKRKTGISFDIKLTAYQLAAQTYHEALLFKLGWVK